MWSGIMEKYQDLGAESAKKLLVLGGKKGTKKE